MSASSATPNEASRRDWRRAWRALCLPIDDPRRAEQVFRIFEALDGPADERLRQRLAEDPRGKRLLRRRPDLLATLTDRDALAAPPEGTPGRRVDGAGATPDLAVPGRGCELAANG